MYYARLHELLNPRDCFAIQNKIMSLFSLPLVHRGANRKRQSCIPEFSHLQSGSASVDSGLSFSRAEVSKFDFRGREVPERFDEAVG